MLWHMRLGHPSLEYMKKMQKYEEKLENVKLKKDISDCETCVLAKMEKLPFKNTLTHYTYRYNGAYYTDIIPWGKQIYNSFHR